MKFQRHLQRFARMYCTEKLSSETATYASYVRFLERRKVFMTETSQCRKISRSLVSGIGAKS